MWVCQYIQLGHEPVSVQNTITNLELRVVLVKGRGAFSVLGSTVLFTRGHNCHKV